MITVRQFSSATELQEHYRSLNARFFPSKPKAVLKIVPKVPAQPDPKIALTKEIQTLIDSLREVEKAEDDFVPEAGGLGAKKIIAHVAQKHGFTAADILGQGKSYRLVAVRWEAIKAVHEMNPHWSLPHIGRIFKRDHTTILHALRRMGVKA